jgi:hypothetical protein
VGIIQAAKGACHVEEIGLLGLGLLLTAGASQALAQERPTTSQLQAPGGLPAQYQRGQILRVDPGKGIIIIRSGTGAQQFDAPYRVSKSTRYFGPDNKELADGLRYSGFKQGANVWYRRRGAPGQASPTTLNVLRLRPAPGTPPGAPGKNPGVPQPGGAPKPGSPGAAGAPGSPPPNPGTPGR